MFQAIGAALYAISAILFRLLGPVILIGLIVFYFGEIRPFRREEAERKKREEIEIREAEIKSIPFRNTYYNPMEMTELKQKANSGDAEACWKLGKVYASVKQIEIANHWARKAAALGHDEAIRFVAELDFMDRLTEEAVIIGRLQEKGY